MSATDWSLNKSQVTAGWLVFAAVNLWLMFEAASVAGIFMHLIWASFILVYGLVTWSRRTTMIIVTAVTIATIGSFIVRLQSEAVEASDATDTVILGLIAALVIWHVDRQRAGQRQLADTLQNERFHALQREQTMRFGSHELRTRLAIARGFVDLISGSSKDTSVRSDSHLVLSELDKATALVTNLTTLVRVETRIPRVPVHIDDQIERIARRWAATERRDWSHSSDVGFILGDMDRIETALDCLIENAVKFTSETDSIRITATVDDAGVAMSVTDSGRGIPPADLDRITTAFETGSTAGDQAGTGLGLAIVASIVASRGGRLEIASALGSGSRFTIRVPTYD
jgi:signal transduction histidine kinase